MKFTLSSVALWIVATASLAGCGGGGGASAAVAANAASSDAAAAASDSIAAEALKRAPVIATPLLPTVPVEAPVTTTTTAQPSDTTVPTAASANSAWYTIAMENESASVAPPAHLRFGTPQQWVYADATGDFHCGLGGALFRSDPNPGVYKQCQTDDPAFRSAKVKVMTIGDSITGFYRDPLVRSVTAAGFKNVDWVGNLPYSYYHQGDPDVDTNGYGGYKGLDLLRPAQSAQVGPNTAPGAIWGYLYGDERDLNLWFQGQAADIVMLEIGSNDRYLGSPDPSSQVASEILVYSKILARARQANRKVRFYVAQLTPAQYGETFIPALNTAITAWAAQNTTSQSAVIVVDQNTGFDVSMTRDGTHPGDAMAIQMAERWLTAIRPYLR